MPRRTPAYAPVVRYLRREGGWSPRELAQLLGVPDYYVGYLENGYRWPRQELVNGLAAAADWSPFELALVADVEIAYPDWPSLTNLDEWRRLAGDWTRITDAITRYVLARELAHRPEWQHALDPTLPEDVEQFGIVAAYGWIRRRWTPYAPHPTRLEAPQSLEAFQAQLGAGSAGTPVIQEPEFLRGLTPQDRAAVEAVAASLKSRRA